MERKELFTLLDRCDFTLDMAEEYFGEMFRLLYPQKERLPNSWIPTPCPIVYIVKEEPRVYVAPFLNLNLKKEVWGIQCNGVLFKKTEEPKADFNKANAMAKELKIGTIHGDLPLFREMKAAYVRKNSFNRTAEILRKNEIDADGWGEDAYWTSDVNEEFIGGSCLMSSGTSDFWGMTQMLQSIRLVLRKL